MFKAQIYSLALLLLLSCNSSKNEETGSDKDSLSHKIIESESWKVELSDKSLKDSFALPSAFIINNVLPIEKEKDGSWEVSTFLRIDSLKKNNTYDQYVNSLDIGQTKDATAWIYDTLIFGASKGLVWGINHMSYEADPYYEGRSIFMTMLSPDNKAINTIKILEISNSGDPPGYAYTNGVCIVESTGNIACNDSIVSGGDTETIENKDYEITEINLTTRKYKVEPSGEIKEFENVKAPTQKITKPAENVDEGE